MSAYPLYFQNKRLDEVKVCQTGLYYSISSRFYPERDGIYVLWAQCGETRVRIGICVPGENGYTIFAKVPTKRFKGNIDQFLLEIKKEETQNFIPVLPDQPVECLHCLEACRFTVCDGIPGMIISVTDIHPAAEDWTGPES